MSTQNLKSESRLHNDIMVMAIERKRAEEIADKLKEWLPDLKVEIRGNENEVVATAPKLRLQSHELDTLKTITRKQTITFGRSGANFRMVIW